MKPTINVLLFLIFMLVTSTSVAQAVEDLQTGTLACGDIVESEFTSNYQRHLYTIDLNSRETLDLLGVPTGGNLKLRAFMYDPAGNTIAFTGRTGYYATYNTVSRPRLVTEILSATGTYKINITNFNWSGGPTTSAGIGEYTLYVKCILSDDTIIEPGDTLVNDTSSETPVSTPQSTEFSGFGFPGLAPVDMSDVARIPMTDGIPFTGAVTPAGSEILGYAFNETTDQRINLNVERLSGNLNLGVVVIDADSNIIYFSALVTSESMSTRIRMPTDGEYMVSVFRLDLLSPDVPEATAFSVQIDMVE